MYNEQSLNYLKSVLSGYDDKDLISYLLATNNLQPLEAIIKHSFEEHLRQIRQAEIKLSNSNFFSNSQQNDNHINSAETLPSQASVALPHKENIDSSDLDNPIDLGGGATTLDDEKDILQESINSDTSDTNPSHLNEAKNTNSLSIDMLDTTETSSLVEGNDSALLSSTTAGMTNKSVDLSVLTTSSVHTEMVSTIESNPNNNQIIDQNTDNQVDNASDIAQHEMSKYNQTDINNLDEVATSVSEQMQPLASSTPNFEIEDDHSIENKINTYKIIEEVNLVSTEIGNEQISEQDKKILVNSESESTVKQNVNTDISYHSEVAQASTDTADATINETNETNEGNVKLAVFDKLTTGENSLNAEVASSQLNHDSIHLKDDALDLSQLDYERAKELSAKPLFNLTNATQSIPYFFDLKARLPSGIQLIKIGGLEHLGLSFDEARLTIEGTPKVSGTHQILFYLYSLERVLLGKKIESIFINEDPKSLWKNIPSNQAEKFAKPDNDADLIISNSHKVMMAGRVRGRSHAHIGTPCDDDFNISYLSDSGWYISAVADGAGSAKFSRLGSKIAVDSSVDFISSKLSDPNDPSKDILTPLIEAFLNQAYMSTNHDNVQKQVEAILGGAAHAALSDIIKKSKEEEFKNEYRRIDDSIDPKALLKSLSTTLILSIAKKIAGKWFCAAYWIGDGAVAIYSQDTKNVHLLGSSDGGMFSGETKFLDIESITAHEIRKRTQFKIVEDFTAFIAMTDGVSDPKFEVDANLVKFEVWDGLWNDIFKILPTDDVKQLEQVEVDNYKARLVDWLNFWSKGNHDDRTISIIY